MGIGPEKFGPTRRRVAHVFVPQRIYHGDPAETVRCAPVSRIMVQLDDGSFLDTEGIEVTARAAVGKADSVTLTLSADTNVHFYNPEEGIPCL